MHVPVFERAPVLCVRVRKEKGKMRDCNAQCFAHILLPRLVRLDRDQTLRDEDEPGLRSNKHARAQWNLTSHSWLHGCAQSATTARLLLN